MTAPVATVTGVTAFLAGLERCGVNDATVNDSLVVVFTIVATGQAGSLTTQAGVAVAELEAWPAVPPHWVHLPSAVQFASTNINTQETLPGWVRHSRQVIGWGDAAEPAQAWIAHVRRVLQDAT